MVYVGVNFASGGHQGATLETNSDHAECILVRQHHIKKVCLHLTTVLTVEKDT